MATLLHLEQVSKRFGGVCALSDISLRIDVGEVHCLAGENGSGKSTLIKILAGITAPDSGLIHLDGRPWRRLDVAEAQRHGIQVIFQDLSLFPNLSVAENLAMGSDHTSRGGLVDWRGVEARAREALAQLEVDLDLAQPVETLSLAQKQLVAIGRTLLRKARLMIMDEPTAALTDLDVQVLFRLIRRLRDTGISVLFVSHKLREMVKISDRFSFLRNGQLVATGPAAAFDQAAIATHMTGRQPQATPARRPVAPGRRSLLRARGLKGGLVQEISFDLAEREILGITGLRGAGQTELALMLFGAAPCGRGELAVAGVPRHIRNVREAIAARIAYVPEDRLTEGLALEHTVSWNLAAATLSSLSGRAGLVSPQGLGRHVSYWLQVLGIRADAAAAPVGTLSGGNQQRVVLGKWLATHPRVLILNRPTVGVDVGSKRELHDQIRVLAMDGLGVILISDDLIELSELCDRTLVMHGGRIVAEVAGDAWDANTLADQLERLC